MSNSVAPIRTEGDLEVVLLHEAHGLLADIINADLYSIGGIPSEQSVTFQSPLLFNHFLILLNEFFVEGARSACIDEKFQNWSLLKGLRWLCVKHPSECQVTGLADSVAMIETWVAKEVPIKFWCSDVNEEIAFPLKNGSLVSFGANTAKHHLLRLSVQLGKLESLCEAQNFSFTPQQLSAVLIAMTDEVRSRLQYHATHILELLGGVFFALNTLIKIRFDKNPTNRVADMTVPDGVSSDIFRDLYGSVLVFKRYDDERIRRNTPVATRCLKMRY